MAYQFHRLHLFKETISILTVEKEVLIKTIILSSAVKDDFESHTWDAFWRTCVKQESAQTVASELQMSIAAVYMAKRRVLKRIQQQIAFLEGETK